MPRPSEPAVPVFTVDEARDKAPELVHHTVRPEPPAQLDVTADESGGIFLEYALAVADYTHDTGDLQAWEQLSHPECGYCAHVAEQARAAHAEGRVPSGATSRLHVAHAIRVSDDFFSVLGRVVTTPSQELDAHGTVVDTGPGGTYAVAAAVVLEEGRWMLRGLDSATVQRPGPDGGPPLAAAYSGPPTELDSDSWSDGISTAAHYAHLDRYVRATGDDVAMRDLTDPSCETCGSLIEDALAQWRTSPTPADDRVVVASAMPGGASDTWVMVNFHLVEGTDLSRLAVYDEGPSSPTRRHWYYAITVTHDGARWRVAHVTASQG
ncbi:DUF6318 family protein [Actinotalea sp. JY-7885]|uniref:DUF6318 family protein n=1 Tax=Actinotalea sp. JY-7885 TaxID=2758576 RepID=UPI00165E60A8|nr:DUF6318 family protein [Actinotalea sp. JY-7885]